MAYVTSFGRRAGGISGLASFGEDCGPGMVFSAADNGCILDRSCPSGQAWDRFQAACVPVVAPPSGDCPAGMTYSPVEGGCVMPHGCSSTQVWSATQRKCVEASSLPTKPSSGSGKGGGGTVPGKPEPLVKPMSLWDGPVPWVLGGAVLIGLGLAASKK